MEILFVIVDQENGCEECWARVEKITGKARGDFPNDKPFEISAEAVFPCEHGAPDFARGIFVEVDIADQLIGEHIEKIDRELIPEEMMPVIDRAVRREASMGVWLQISRAAFNEIHAPNHDIVPVAGGQLFGSGQFKEFGRNERMPLLRIEDRSEDGGEIRYFKWDWK